MVDCCVVCVLTFVLVLLSPQENTQDDAIGNRRRLRSHNSSVTRRKQKRKTEERERQRVSEPAESNISEKFLQGMDLPEGLVRSSKSGSMTQEIFFYYCKHFVASRSRTTTSCHPSLMAMCLGGMYLNNLFETMFAFFYNTLDLGL
jgi:hypothetical protein